MSIIESVLRNKTNLYLKLYLYSDTINKNSKRDVEELVR